MCAVKKCGGDQADAGKMLHSQQGFFSKSPVSPRHAETQTAKPRVRAERDAHDAGRFFGKSVRHPVLIREVSLVRHQISGDDQPRQKHADVAHDANKTDGERGMRVQFFLDASFQLLGFGTELCSSSNFFRREEFCSEKQKKNESENFHRGFDQMPVKKRWKTSE